MKTTMYSRTVSVLAAAVMAALALTSTPASAALTMSVTGDGTAATLNEWAGECDGYRFQTGDSALIVSWLGFYDAKNGTSGSTGDGLLGSHQVSIWKESDGSLVTRTTIAAGTGETLVGSFRGHDVSPVTLDANTAYVIGANFASDGDRQAEGNTLTGWGFNGISNLAGRYGGTGGGMPTEAWAILMSANFGFTYALGADPVALPGGPYSVLSIGSLTLNGSASRPSVGQTLTNYDWDLDDDGDFDEAVTGATPAAISYATLTTAPPAGYGMVPGDNTINLRVTDSAAKTAITSTTVTLIVASSDADLFSLETTPYMDLTPAFDSGTINYTATAPYSTTSMTVKPTKSDAGATIGISIDSGSFVSINSGSASAPIPLDVGIAKVIALKVTAQDTTTKTYTLTVTRSAPSNNANLDSLEASAGTLSPPFSSNFISYTATVPYPTASMTVTPTAAHPGATIKVNDVAVASGSASAPISLSVGANVITTVVTAEDTTTKSYTLTVTREPDTAPPVIASLSPADDTAAGSTSNCAVTFDEPIAIGTGSITIKNTDPVPDPDVVIDITSGSPQVSVSGAVLTINPTADLVVGKSYAIQIAATAIKDLFNNPFGGILDDTTWNFTATFPSYTWTQTTGGAQSWTTGTNWLGDAVPVPATGATVDFSTVNIAANTTLTLGDDRTAGTWKFGDTSGAQTWTVSAANKIILAGTTPTIEVKQNTATLSNVVDGNQGLTKAGAGTLVLGGVNTYSGGTVINAGTVSIGSNANLGDTAGGITFGGSAYLLVTADFATARSITLNNTGATAQISGNVAGPSLRTFTASGAVTGNGGIFLGGGNTPTKLILSNTGNSFTGSIFIGNPTVQNVGGLGYRLETASLADSASPTPITFGYGNTAPGQNHEHSFVWTGASALALNNRYFEFGPLGGGNNGWGVIESANANAANTLTINTDLVVSGTGSNTSKGLTLQGANTGANTFAGKIVDGTSTPIVLLKAGNGTWVVSGNNTFTGGTTVNAGLLRANGANALGAGNVTVSAGTLQIDAADAMADTATLRLPSATAKNLTMNANDTVAKLFIAGVQQPNGTYSAATNASAWMNTGSGSLTVGPAASQPVFWDLNDTANGAGGATPAGIWDAANMYWNNAPGTGTAVAWTAGATAAFAAGTDATGTYSVTVDGMPDIGGLTFEEGTVTLSGGTALRLVSDSVAFVNTGLTATVQTPISQDDPTARALTKSGTGTLVLSGTNSYTGPTAVGAGTLQLTNTSAIGTSSALTLSTGGTLALRSDATGTFSTPGNGTTLFGEIANGATATVDVNNLSSGSGNTLKLGGGTGIFALAGTTTTLTVTGGNGYVLRSPVTLKRTTNVSPILALNPTTASVIVDGLYLIDVAGGSLGLTLGGTNTGANEVTGTLTGSGLNGAWLTLTKNTAAKWKWSVAVTTTNALNTTAISAGDLIVTGTLMCQGGRNLTQSGGTLHYNSPTAVSANGTSAWIITGGNLDNTSGGPVTSTGNPLMQWNGNFTFLGSNGAASDLNLGTGAVTMNATRTVTVSNALTTMTVGGAISDGTGVFGLTKAGPGTLKLTGASTYDGPTTVSDGTLAVTGSLGATAVIVNAGTLGGTGTVNGAVTVAAAGSVAPGASVGTLAVKGGLTLSAMADGGSGKLKFELATPAASDQIAVTGALTIGSGVLGFSDFSFMPLTGFGVGTYKLVTTTTGITGTLDPNPANLSGVIGAFTGTLKITGNDLELEVTAGGLAGYALWAATNAPSGTVNDDYDRDGVSNGVEYVLGGTKDTNDLAKLPTASTTPGGDVLFTFVRDQASIDGTTAVAIEVGTTLAAWPDSYAVPGTAVANNPGVTVVKDSPAVGKDTVTLAVPRAPDATKFARLKVTVP